MVCVCVWPGYVQGGLLAVEVQSVGSVEMYLSSHGSVEALWPGYRTWCLPLPPGRYSSSRQQLVSMGVPVSHVVRRLPRTPLAREVMGQAKVCVLLVHSSRTKVCTCLVCGRQCWCKHQR
mmetsp:Transcript_28750/g.73176  ORF Transcript_28750/g.73176 Transcript_28750/m.73176 type:complete len:120 (+) Transcript_28750:1307-1666(+)